jgi:hypothetical protein
VPALHISSPGQSPPHAGKPDWTQGTVSGSQRQIVPAGSLAQVCPAGQFPPHAGAVDAVQGIGFSFWQKHSFADALKSQRWPAGQSPPHSGAVLCAHGAGLQKQPPVAPETHSSPSAQRPSHAGAVASPQATSSGAQTHGPAALGRQDCDGPHDPAQRGAAAVPQPGCAATHWQLPATSIQAYPVSQAPPHAGEADSPHGAWSGSHVQSGPDVPA